MNRKRIGPTRLTLGSSILCLLVGLPGCEALERYQARAKGAGAGPAAQGAKDFNENPDPEKFLPIPEGANTIRVVVSGEGWEGYDRSCTKIVESSSYHSVGMRRATIATEGCESQNGGMASADFARYDEGGLTPGVFDIVHDGRSATSAVALQPPKFPHVHSHLTGKLWVRRAQVDAQGTEFEVSYYGKTKWAKSEADSTEIPVDVQVALRVKVRNTDVPE